MYTTRESVEGLTKLGENKEKIVLLLKELAQLGWNQSHWVKYMGTNEKPFIEIYGDGSYKHIKGDTIEQCYEIALTSVKKLKTCEHQYKYREDAFKICEKCGKSGKASLQEMKERFEKFSVKSAHGNTHYFSDETLCEKCEHKEMLKFSHSRKEEIGYMCPNCKNVIPKRLKTEKYRKYGLTASPIDPAFKENIPYREKDITLSLHRLKTFGCETEQSLKMHIQRSYEFLLESAEATEKVIDPNYTLTEQEIVDYLKQYVLHKEFDVEKEGKRYQLLDLGFTFDENQIETVEFVLKEKTSGERKPSDEQILSEVIKSIAETLQKEE